MSTLELVREFLLSKIPVKKNKNPYNQSSPIVPPPPPENISINHIAIILDGRVEEVIRCENRLAALLLSNPKFVEFDPDEILVKIGQTRYEDEKLKNIEEPMITETEMDELIQKEKNKNG